MENGAKIKRFFKRLTPFDAFNVLIMLALSFLMLYPFWYMLSVSISHSDYVADIILIPRGIGFGAFTFIFRQPLVYHGYFNSFFYAVAGVAVSMFLTILTAYALSKRWLIGKRFFLVFIMITMYFSGGLIPLYAVIYSLGMLDSVWAVIIPGAVNTYNIIVMRTYFLNSIPKELEEAARIDGAGEVRILFKVYLPLSVPIIATVTLFYFVAAWNSWMPAFIYLTDETKYPIQLVMRNVIKGDNLLNSLSEAQRAMLNDRTSPSSLNYALTIAVILPVLIIYPFFQRFFAKGIMVGSLKG
jgi:putative aldouronate transport system permease protein